MDVSGGLTLNEGMRTEAMSEEPISLISTDGHASPSKEAVLDYLEPKYHDLLEENIAAVDRYRRLYGNMALREAPAEVLRIIDPEGLIRQEGRSGGHDIRRRLAEMDREGVAAEVVGLGAQTGVNPFCEADEPRQSLELHDVGARAWNRWMADMSAESDGRLIGVALPGTCRDIDTTVNEARWAASHGFGAMFMPGQFAADALPPLYDRYFEPLWAECAALDLALYVHAGWGIRQGQAAELLSHLEKVRTGKRFSFGMDTVESAMSALDVAARMVPFEMMLGGVFDRHPELRLVLAEMRADWVPAHVAHLDRRFDEGGVPLKRRPSEYWRENVWLNVSSIHRAEAEIRHEIGADHMMFGVDYPHPESTWPNTHDWIRAAFEGIPEDEARAILGENAIRCFGLDRQRMAGIARKIGPSPAAVLGHHDVDRRVVAHFQARAGYAKPVPTHQAELVARCIEEDLAGMRLVSVSPYGRQ